MDQGRVSVSYARALLSWSTDKKLAKEVYSQSYKLLSLIDDNPEFYQILHSPIIPLSKKGSIVSQVIKNVAPTLSGFILLVVKNRREKSLKNILLVFQRLYREHFGIIKAVVESVVLIGETTQEVIKNYLANVYSKKVELEFRLKPDIIGGFILTIDDGLLDRSVKGELEKLRRTLMGTEF